MEISQFFYDFAVRFIKDITNRVNAFNTHDSMEEYKVSQVV